MPEGTRAHILGLGLGTLIVGWCPVFLVKDDVGLGAQHLVLVHGTPDARVAEKVPTH